MATTTLDKIESQIKKLTDADQTELLRRLSDSPRKNGAAKKSALNGPKTPPNPNLVWIKENGAKYGGNYVALKDGELIAYGRTIKEADQAAKAKGVKNPFLHYIMAEGEVAWWGGWL